MMTDTLTNMRSISDETVTPSLTRAPYHAPELVEHGELAALTKGVGSTFIDGGSYTSIVP